MTEEMVINLGSEAIKTVIFLSGPMLAAAMIVGILVSVIQAVTQINESTLTFIPKMVAVVAVLSVMAPWMLDVIQQYATHMIGNAGEWIR